MNVLFFEEREVKLKREIKFSFPGRERRISFVGMRRKKKTHMKRGCLGLLGVAVCLATAAENSVEPEPADTLIRIPEVLVTAMKTGTAARNVPLSITSVSREQIERSSESALLPVLSQQVPGLFVTQRGIMGFGVSDGAAGTVNIRGVGQGNKVLMLFDGQPQWAGVFGHALPDTYVASDVERVEVVRGPASLLYGSNAMGGVVNMITRSQTEDGAATRARVMYGSYNTQKYMVNNGVRYGKFNSFVSVNHDRTDGHRDNTDFNITNGFVRLGYEPSRYFKIGGNASVAYYETSNPGAEETPIFDSRMHIWRGTASVSAEDRFEKSRGAIQLFYNWGNHEINDGHTAHEAPTDFLFHTKDYNYGVLAYQSFFLWSGNQFTAGVDYKHWGGKAWNAYFSGDRKDLVDRSVSETAGYAAMQQELASMLTLNAGVRYEHNSAFGGEWVPQAGFTLNPFESTLLKASFSKGFRSPNIRELYLTWGPRNQANPDLKPEHMLNYEVAIGQYFQHRRYFAEVTLFYIDGKNMIQLQTLDGNRRQLANSGEFTHKGIEFDGYAQLTKRLRLSVNYSFLHTSRDIEAAPKHKAFADLVFTPGRFTVDLNTQAIFGLLLKSSSGEFQSEDYALLNARVAYRFGEDKRNLQLFVKGENLTNTSYSINAGYPMPGIVVMGGVEVKF